MQDIAENDVVVVPDPQAQKPRLWDRMKDRFFGSSRVQGLESQGASSLPSEDDPLEPQPEQSEDLRLTPLLTRKFFSSVGDLEQELPQIESKTEKLEAEAYLKLRKAQAQDRTEDYGHVVPLESYSILSDNPTEEEQQLISTLLDKDPRTMNSNEVLYIKAVFNPDLRDGDDILAKLGLRLSIYDRQHKQESTERMRSLRVSEFRSEVARVISAMVTKGFIDSDIKDKTLQALVAKDELIDRVRDGEYS